MSHRLRHRLGGALVATTILALLVGCTAAPVSPTWVAPKTGIAAHAKAAGLQILPDEGTVLHIHTHLNVTFDGRPVTVPANIGIDTKQKLYSELHTHDTSGIVHVEAATKKTFYLRQFFTEWGVALGAKTVGDYTDGKNNTRVRMYVNRQPYTRGFDTLALKNKADVTIAITTDGKLPAPAKKFAWPSNY